MAGEKSGAARAFWPVAIIAGVIAGAWLFLSSGGVLFLMILGKGMPSWEQKLTPLHRAVESGNIQSVRQLVKDGANLEATTTYARTPLQVAAEEGNLEITRFLLESGATVYKDGRVDVMFERAVMTNNCELIRLLVAHGARGNPLSGVSTALETRKKFLSNHPSKKLGENTCILKFLLDGGAKLPREGMTAYGTNYPIFSAADPAFAKDADIQAMRAKYPQW